MTGADGGIPEAVLAEARARYADVMGRIAEAAGRAGRDASEVGLVGVAKRQPRERVLAAIEAGVHVLGQSYIQEARQARPEIESALATRAANANAEAPVLEWRMVGRLQRNKAGLAVRLFEAIESVDRVELATKLSRLAEAEGRWLEVLLQLSLCGEPQKGGCEPDQLRQLAEAVLELPMLRLAGLMTVPAADPDPEKARPTFARLRELLLDLEALDPELARGQLSMGMSGDLEVAIEEGATLVRVGTALFGDRSVD
jgi:PLP dependent protein